MTKWFLFTLFIINISASLSFAKELSDKEGVVEKHLKGNISFEKKVKMIVAFQGWIEKQISAKGSKLEEKDIEEYMVYSNLLKVLKPKALNPKNCVEMANNVIDEDLSPVSDEPSTQAKKLLEWMKLICKK